VTTLLCSFDTLYFVLKYYNTCRRAWKGAKNLSGRSWTPPTMSFSSFPFLLRSLEEGLNSKIPIEGLRKVVADSPEDLDGLLGQIMESIRDKFGNGPEVLLVTIMKSARSLLSTNNGSRTFPSLTKHISIHGGCRILSTPR
jgi:hypothetical protein